MSRYINLFDEEIIMKVLIAYLVDSLSHRQIQKEVLGLPAPARGGGFIAMDILHHFGIQGDKKGVLKERNGIDEFNSADGSYKEAIKKVLEYIELSKIVEKNINQGNFAFTSDSTEFATQTKVRINQGVLRKIVLKDYDQQCALCSIDKPNLLICSHIKPWAIDSDNRLNPSNAICLCVLHDALFDKGYIGLNKDYKIIISQKSDEMIKKLMEGCEFRKPKRYLPDINFLEFHLNEICE